MADNVIETGRSRIEDILLKASNGEALSRIEEILVSLYQDLVHLGPDGKIPAKDTGKPEGTATSGDTVSKSVETAASLTPAPVKDKVEGKTEKKPKSGSPITPADRTKVMNKLKKLVPELRECLMDRDLARINTYFEVEKPEQKIIDKKIDAVQEEAIKDFVLSFRREWSQSGDTDRKEFVSDGLKNVLTERLYYGNAFIP